MNFDETLKPQIDALTEISLGQPHKVILFNDENHSMDEVTFQIMKAIRCDAERAFGIMMEAHNTGRAIVFSGVLERCELVASILEQIRLGTTIEPA
jgi:ATP-dependent Clp protease adaptor protein ClpS